MVESKKEKFYFFSNDYKAFNGEPLAPGNVLFQVVLSKEMEETLKNRGLKKEFIRTWKIRRSNKTVPVVFIPVHDDPSTLESMTKFYNEEVRRYLSHDEFGPEEDVYSTDAILEKIYDKDGRGFDPTGTNKYEDIAAYESILELLISELSKINGIDGKIIDLIIKGYSKKDIISLVDIGKGKTQAYDYIDKVKYRAKKFIDEIR